MLETSFHLFGYVELVVFVVSDLPKSCFWREEFKYSNFRGLSKQDALVVDAINLEADHEGSFSVPSVSWKNKKSKQAVASCHHSSCLFTSSRDFDVGARQADGAGLFGRWRQLFDFSVVTRIVAVAAFSRDFWRQAAAVFVDLFLLFGATWVDDVTSGFVGSSGAISVSVGARHLLTSVQFLLLLLLRQEPEKCKQIVGKFVNKLKDQEWTYLSESLRESAVAASRAFWRSMCRLSALSWCCCACAKMSAGRPGKWGRLGRFGRLGRLTGGLPGAPPWLYILSSASRVISMALSGSELGEREAEKANEQWLNEMRRKFFHRLVHETFPEFLCENSWSELVIECWRF